MTLDEARKNAPESDVVAFSVACLKGSTKAAYLEKCANYWRNIAEQLLKDKENG